MKHWATRSRNHVIRLSLLAIITALPLGCTDVAMSGAQVVYNRHSIQKNLTDHLITREAFKRIKIDNDQFKNANVVIATFNNEVLLVGQAPTRWQIRKAEQIVKAIPAVKSVYNLLTIASPSSTLTRLSDAWITSKIKTKFLASDDVEANQIKVITENGTVYLMGILPPSQAEAATDIARTTDGVEKVVKVFSYITISKHLPAGRNHTSRGLST